LTQPKPKTQPKKPKIFESTKNKNLKIIILMTLYAGMHREILAWGGADFQSAPSRPLINFSCGAQLQIKLARFI
jgi:hypothetical protein